MKNNADFTLTKNLNLGAGVCDHPKRKEIIEGIEVCTSCGRVYPVPLFGGTQSALEVNNLTYNEENDAYND
jgi:hypothetical protein